MSNETTTGLKRVTYLPDRDVTDNGRLIAGQNYDDVYFAGGIIENVSLVNVNVAVTYHEEYITSGTTNAVTLLMGDSVVLWNSSDSGDKTQTIPTSTGSKQEITIVDVYGNSDTYPINISAVSGNIAGQASVSISTPKGSITILDTQAGWIIKW